MANAYSERANFVGPLSSSNHQLDMMVLGAKQQAYDANIAKIDSIIEAYGNIPLTREKDKQALANNINAMLVEVNSYSKDALTSESTVRNINQVMKGALTPEILKHSAITVQKRNVDALVAKKREKNDGTYSDGNYQDMLDQAGWESYMRGETDDINELRYNDYVDTGKIIRDQVSKWAEDFGYDVEITNSPTDINGISIKSKTKKLSPEKINSFVESLVMTDPKLNTQLDINSRLSFRGMTDDQFKEMYEGSVQKYEESARAKILEAETYRDNYAEGSEEYKYYQDRIKQIKSGVEEFKAPLNGGNFNRGNIQRQIYRDSLLKSISSNYAYERLESEEFDSTIFNAQIKMDNLSIQKEKLNLSKGLDAQGNPLNAGIVSEERLDLEDEPTAVTRLRSGYQDKWNEVDQAIASIKGEEYSSLPEEERMKIVSTFADMASEYDINNSPIPAEVLEKVDEFNKGYTRYKEYQLEATKSLTPVVRELYQTMLEGGSNINLGNLSSSMRRTAEMLRNKVSYDKLSEKDKLLVSAEIAKSSAQYLARNAEEREDWEMVANEYYKKLTPEERKQIDQSVKKEYSTVGGVGRSAMLFVGNALGSSGKRLSALWNTVTGNPLAAQRDIVEERINTQNTMRDIGTMLSQKTANPFNFIKPDRTIGDMQAGDINQSVGLSTIYEKSVAHHNTKFRAKRDEIMSERKVVNTITYNPDVVQDKPYVEAISSAIRTEGKIPSPKGNYSVRIVDGQYEFTFDSEVHDGKRKVLEKDSVLVPEERVPSIIRGQISTKPARAVPTILGYKYKVPQSAGDKVNTINSFVNSFSTSAPAQALDALYTGQVFPSKEEFRNRYKYKLNSPEKERYFENIVNSNYSTKVHTLPSGLQKIELLVNGESTNIVKDISGTMTPYVGASNTAILVEEYIKEKLNEL